MEKSKSFSLLITAFIIVSVSSCSKILYVSVYRYLSLLLLAVALTNVTVDKLGSMPFLYEQVHLWMGVPEVGMTNTKTMTMNLEMLFSPNWLYMAQKKVVLCLMACYTIGAKSVDDDPFGVK